MTLNGLSMLVVLLMVGPGAVVASDRGGSGEGGWVGGRMEAGQPSASPSAWEDADTNRTGLVGLSRAGLVAAWALTQKRSFDAAILLVHETEDDRVQPSGSIAFTGRLVEAGHPHRLILLEAASYDLTSHFSDVRTATGEWLSQYLLVLRIRPNPGLIGGGLR